MQPALQCIFPMAFKIQIAKGFSVISPWHRRSIWSLSTQTCLRIDIRKLLWATQEGGKSKAINSSSLALLSHLYLHQERRQKKMLKAFCSHREEFEGRKKDSPPFNCCQPSFFFPKISQFLIYIFLLRINGFLFNVENQGSLTSQWIVWQEGLKAEECKYAW